MVKSVNVRVPLGVISGTIFLVVVCQGCALKMDTTPYGTSSHLESSSGNSGVAPVGGGPGGNPPPGSAVPPSNPPPSGNDVQVTQGLPASQNISAGSALSLKVVAASKNGLTLQYQWSKDGVALAGETTDSLTIAALAKSDAGTYSCAISDADGSISVQAMVNVNNGQGQNGQNNELGFGDN
jgi:hypothetical protein